MALCSLYLWLLLVCRPHSRGMAPRLSKGRVLLRAVVDMRSSVARREGLLEGEAELVLVEVSVALAQPEVEV